MKIKVSEKDVQRTILAWCELQQNVSKLMFWRNNTGAVVFERKNKSSFVRFGSVGSPDIFILSNGKLYGVECKGSTGKLSDAQAEFGRKMMVQGGEYIVAHDLNDVIKVFKGRSGKDEK